MEPALKVGSKRPTTDSPFDERMCIICQLPAKSKKLTTLCEDGCDKLLKAASDRWERRDYDNVGVIDRLRLVDLKQLLREKIVKYHRSCYLADMKNIEVSHPDVFAGFVAGNFVVKKTGQSFHQISTDQALEHVNKICKVAGGLISITRLESARERWCLTFNQRSDIAQQTMDMYGLQSEDTGKRQKSKYTGATRIGRDEEDVKLIEQQLKRFHLHVFSIDQQDLVAIASRDVAPEELGNAMLNAECRGKEKIRLFVDTRLKSQQVSFHDAVTNI